MTTTRRFAAALASLTAAMILFAVNPAAAGLVDRTEAVTTGEAVMAPAPVRTAALQAVEPETTATVERPATVKRVAPTARAPYSRRAERPAKKEYRARPSFAAPVRYAGVPVPSYGSNCHRR
jgi:V8-like Glu-specific endopeptidase